MLRPIAADGTIRYSTAAAFATALVQRQIPSTTTRAARTSMMPRYIFTPLDSLCPFVFQNAEPLRRWVGGRGVDSSQRPREPVEEVLDLVARVVIRIGIHVVTATLTR